MNVSAESTFAPRLPQVADVEKALLGSVISNGAALREVNEILRQNHFFVVVHRRIFACIERLAAEGQPFELVTLCDALKDDPEVCLAGGAAYIASLCDGAYQKAPVAHWARMIREAAYLRAVAHAGESLKSAALKPQAKVAEVAELAQAIMLSFDKAPTSSRASLVAVSVEELLAREIKPREMLLDPILPEQGLAMLYAYRGIGKTFLSLGIAAAVASGGAFLRWTAQRPRRVLYVDGELPAKTLQERSAMILAGLEGAEPAPDMLRIITPDVQNRAMPDLATPEGQRILEPHLEGVGLVVIDNLSALCRYGNENEGEGWLPVQEWALTLRRRGISVLFDHHAGKNKSQRGTSRREDLLDTVITLKHPPDYDPSEGLRCEVHFEKTRAMLGDEAKPFEVRLQSGPDGRAIWSMRELEDAKRQQGNEMFASGMTVRDVAEELRISKSAAGRLREKWKADRDLSQRPTV